MTSPSEEQAVIRRYQEALAGTGDPDQALGELNQLFSQYQDRVYRVCLRYTPNTEQALELTQDTLLLAFRKLPEFRGEARFSTWLHSLARNLSMNAVRRRRETLVEDGVVDPTDPRMGALSSLRHSEREALFLRVSSAVLDPIEQEAVYLRYVEQLPQDTITTVLGLSEASGARGLLQRCRRKLTRALRQELEALGHGSSFFLRTW